MNSQYSLLPSLFIALAGGLSAATPIPSWDGEPTATRVGYTFSTDANPPDATPATLNNVFGTPVSTLVLHPVFSSGWRDPANPFALSGADSDGAWDLGFYSADVGVGDPVGYFEVSVPIALGITPVGQSYNVEFVVYSVAFRDGLVFTPTLDMQGQTVSGLTSNDELVANDPPLSGAWRGLTWSGTIENVTSDEVTFRLIAPDTATTVIDSVEIFTRTTVVPEPSTSLLILSFSACALLGYRRRQS